MPRILIIDDEATIAESCALALTGAGYQVLLAKDGRAALQLLKTEKADLILTDLQMPYGGLPALRTLRRLHRNTPIIAMSGAGKAKLELAGILGAHQILAKPFKPDQLLSAVAELLATTSKKS